MRTSEHGGKVSAPAARPEDRLQMAKEKTRSKHDQKEEEEEEETKEKESREKSPITARP